MLDFECYKFLTTNAKKAQEFRSRGFNVAEFHTEIKEVLSSSVAQVALYKAADTHMRNILVEDTSLTIEGAPFLGPQIKDYWALIEHDTSYHLRQAVWQVSICLATEDNFIVSTGTTQGKLLYPGHAGAYHFDRNFSVEKSGRLRAYGSLSEHERREFSPRAKALELLQQSLKSRDYGGVWVIPKEQLKPWTGMYQEPPVFSPNSPSHEGRAKKSFSP